MKPELPIFGLVAMLIAGIIVLTALKIAVPQDMWLLLIALVTGGLGIAVPGRVTVSAPVAGGPPPTVARAVLDPFTAPATPAQSKGVPPS